MPGVKKNAQTWAGLPIDNTARPPKESRHSTHASLRMKATFSHSDSRSSDRKDEDLERKNISPSPSLTPALPALSGLSPSRSGCPKRVRIPPRFSSSKTPKARRGPVFTLTPAQVIAHCRKKHHCLWVAGQVLALMALMQARNWSTLELAERSGVSRSHLSEVLVLETTASTNVLHILAETFGFEMFEFHLLTAFALRAEVSG
jgi:hypothetical protein